MATSGVTSVSYTANDIIKLAYQEIGAINNDTPVVPRHLSDLALTRLNMLVAMWQSSRGLRLWKEASVKLITVPHRHTYSFGSEADSFIKLSKETAAIASASASDSTIDVKGVIGDYADGDTIVIHFSNGNIQTTTVNGAPSGIAGGVRLTLTDVLASDLSLAGQVETWKSYTGIPLRVVRAYRLDSPDSTTAERRTEIDVWGRNKWHQQNNHLQDGAPYAVYFDRKLNAASIKIWTESAEADVLLRVHEPQELFTSLDDNPDMQPEWYLALVYNLAVLLSGRDMEPYRRNAMRKDAEMYLEAAEEHDEQLDHLNITADTSDYDYDY